MAIDINHPNHRFTGSALTIVAVPSKGFSFRLAPQLVGTSVFPKFDWTNDAKICLGFDEMGMLLGVLRGVYESIADGKGIFHRTIRDCGTTAVLLKLSHRIEPIRGYLLEIRQETHGETGGEILLTVDEAMALCASLESSMGRVFLAD